MKKQYLSPTTEIVNLDAEELATNIPITGSKADGGDAMAKQNTGFFEEDGADEGTGYGDLWGEE